MRLWTIQPGTVWQQLEERGALFVDPRCQKPNGYVPPAYQWLRGQLRERLPSYAGHLPWWAYCAKPDLRWHRHACSGDQVRLELQPDLGRVIRFPCWAWDTVFRQDYLSVVRREYEQWWARARRAVPDEDAWPLPEPWRGRLERTWDRLFDPDLPRMSWDRESVWFKKLCIEAVLELLQLQDVREVTFFQGTAKPLQTKTQPAADTARF